MNELVVLNEDTTTSLKSYHLPAFWQQKYRDQNSRMETLALLYLFQIYSECVGEQTLDGVIFSIIKKKIKWLISWCQKMLQNPGSISLSDVVYVGGDLKPRDNFSRNQKEGVCWFK